MGNDNMNKDKNRVKPQDQTSNDKFDRSKQDKDKMGQDKRESNIPKDKDKKW